MPNPFASLEQFREVVPLFHLQVLGEIHPVDLTLAVEGAVALAILGSIDSLLTSLVADQLTHERHDSNRELVGRGPAISSVALW